MMSLNDIGFTREMETDKAVLWSCPLGKFWRPKKLFKYFTRATLDNLAAVADEVAREINDSWVIVKVLSRTDGGGVHISFKASRVLSEEDERSKGMAGFDIGPLSKSAKLLVPAVWLLEIGGRTAAPAKKLADKLVERREHADRRRKGYAWRPDAGGIVNAEQVLTWLQKSNADALNKRKEDDAQQVAALKQSNLERQNGEIEQQFNTLLVQQYGQAARAFAKTAKGKKSMSDLVGRYCHDLNFVKAALKQKEFVEWAREWEVKHVEREAIREAKPKPTRTPDQVLENASVEWVDWVGTSNNKMKIKDSATGCRVKYFGAKREIALPDGRIIVKMAGPNLKIVAAL